MRKGLLHATLVLTVLLGALVPLTAQDSLSQQVLRLLVRDNEWTGTNTFDRAVGIKLERALVPVASPTDRLENRGGNLYFNDVLVAPSAGVGTVTSVALALPAIFTISGSPVTSTGTLTGTLATQSANVVWAGPTTGSAASPTFRALVAADLPPVPGSGLTGVVPVANGGTGLSSGTSGGILAFTASGTVASSGALTANRLVIGGGAGVVPTVVGSLGTTTTVLHGNAGGAPTFGAVNLGTDVTSTLGVVNGGTGLAAGTSGGIPYFSASTTVASSAALTANRIVLGGGAGAAPTVLAAGTATTVLHGNASGAPSFSAIVLSTDVSGTLPVANGGTGAATLTGVLIGNGTSAVTAATSSTVGQVLRVTGANTYALGALDLADTDAVTGVLPAANGGTGVAFSGATNGQLPIGNGSGVTLAALTGTTDQLTVTNGSGSITLSLPQAIATTSTPQFARLGLGTGAGATAVLTTTGIFDVGLFDNGNCAVTDTVTWSVGMVQKSTLTGNCTYTFQAPVAAGTWFTLQVIQDGVGSRLVTWPGTVIWEGGSAPTLSTVAGSKDLCSFFWDGTSYIGRCLIVT